MTDKLEKLKILVDAINAVCESDISDMEVGDSTLAKNVIEYTDTDELNMTRLTLLGNAVLQYSFETGAQFDWNIKQGSVNVLIRRVK